jgi:hypothetical protein
LWEDRGNKFGICSWGVRAISVKERSRAVKKEEDTDEEKVKAM